MSEIKNIDLLDHVKQNPKIYLGKKSIYGLQCFISGCLSNGKSLGIDWQEFEIWVAKKVGFKTSSMSYGAAKYTTDSEEAAFDTWVEWLQEFRKENQREPAPTSS